MGLFDFFRRRGAGAIASGPAGGEGPPDARERDEASIGPAGFGAEGPPVGASDPGALTGGDAEDVAGRVTEG